MDPARLLGMLCTFLCAVLALACGAVMVLVVRDECQFSCTEDTPGAVLENEGVYSCGGMYPLAGDWSAPFADTSVDCLPCPHAGVGCSCLSGFSSFALEPVDVLGVPRRCNKCLLLVRTASSLQHSSTQRTG